MLTNLVEKYDYSDVLIVPNDSDIKSRSEVNIERDFRFPYSPKVMRGVGIIAANMDTVGTIPMAKALAKHSVFTALHKHIPKEMLSRCFVNSTTPDSLCNWGFVTIGAGQAGLDLLEHLHEKNSLPSMICIDIANGYLEMLLETVAAVRRLYPDTVIMAGNVVTGPRAVKLYEAGADIIKVGIGPGSACTTRKQTGVGYPQLSAVHECSRALEASGALVCADGGCTVPGDVGKAMIAGADFVMLGGMLAGHDESGGELVIAKKKLRNSVQYVIDGAAEGPLLRFCDAFYLSAEELPSGAWKMIPLEKPLMTFYGMSSQEAMNKHSGGMASYRSSEGRSVTIPYRGPVNATILDILGGLRSTMSYVGVREADMLAYSAEFVKTRHQLNTVFVK